MKYYQAFKDQNKKISDLPLSINLKVRIDKTFYNGPFLFGNYKDMTLMSTQEYVNENVNLKVIKYTLKQYKYEYKAQCITNKLLFCINRLILPIVGSYYKKDFMIWSAIPSKDLIAKLAKQDASTACFKMAHFLNTNLSKASEIINIAKSEI